MKFLLLVILVSGFFHPVTEASSITIHSKSATVWLPHQTIAGFAVGLDNEQIIIHVNDASYKTKITNKQFSFTVILHGRENTIWAEGKSKGKTVRSDTITFQ